MQQIIFFITCFLYVIGISTKLINVNKYIIIILRYLKSETEIQRLPKQNFHIYITVFIIDFCI